MSDALGVCRAGAAFEINKLDRRGPNKSGEIWSGIAFS